MKALVTGGAGFIGSHLCELLLNEGLEVISVDSLVAGQRRNIAPFEEHSQFQFHHLDVRDGESLTKLMDGCDYVFHLAGLADVVPSMEKPQAYYENNVTGTFHVLEAARTVGIRRLVYAASSSCYGIADEYPTPETAPIQPQYPYALTKYLGEELVLHWGQVYKIPVVSLRLFNVYGPRTRTTGTYGAVFGVFLAQKLAGKPYTVVGDGNQSRDFTYVTDVASAFFAAARSDVRNEILNVGSGTHNSINRLVELLGGPVTYVPKRPGEPDCTFADTTRIRSLLDWEPRVSFEEGVGHMLSHIQDWAEAPVWETGSIAKATEDWFKYLGKSS